jgi:hypothetical protein
MTPENPQILLQITRVKRLLNRQGWTLHLKSYANGRLYVAAARRDVNGKWHGVYIGRDTKLGLLTDDAIIAKLHRSCIRIH